MVALRKWYALTALVLCVLTIGLDVTVLNVALATLAEDLDATTSELQWIVSAYLITFSVLMLPAGVAGDRWGRKKVMLAGVALFGVSSALAAFADDTVTLIAARAIMGVGAAIIMPLSMSILPSIFPAHERSKAISIWSVGMALGLPLGPILGGWLLENYWWGSVFLINVPMVLVALIAAAILLPESKDPDAPALDLVTVMLSVSGLGLLIYGVIEAPAMGWGSVSVLGTLITGGVLLGLFVWRNLKQDRPLVDLTLFRNRIFAWGTVATVIVSLCMMGTLFVVPLYLQAVNGYTALETGVRLVPMIVGLGVAGRLAHRFDKRAAVTGGMLLLAIGFGIGATTGISSGYLFTSIWLTLVGLGVGLAMVPAMDAVLATLPEHRAGAGSGLVQTLRQVAGVFAVAGLGSLLSQVYRAQLPPGMPEPVRESIVAATKLGLADVAAPAFVAGMDAVLAACCAGAVIGAVLVATFWKVRQSGHELARLA